MPLEKPEPRFCVVGDSHSAAFKIALNGNSLEHAFTFFVAAGRNMERTFVENGVIKPRTKRVRDSFLSSSGGLREIEISNYDGFIVCGMGLGVARLLLQANTHLPLPLALKSEKYQALSDEGWSVSAREAISESIAFRFVRYFQEFSEKPVALIPEPAPVETFEKIERGSDMFRWLSEPFAMEAYRSLLTIHTEALENICSKFGLHLIPQAEHTLQADGLTKSKFHRSDLENDIGHMNVAYGEAILENPSYKNFVSDG